MDQEYTGWIDIPVVDAIEYFSGILATFLKWGTHYAQFIGLLGLCWGAFKLANSRFTVKDFWWDTLYKWLIFLLVLNLYVPITVGISVVSNKIGIQAGNGKETICQALKNMKASIMSDLAKEQQWEEELSVELKTNFDNLDLPALEQNQSYSSYMDSVYDAVNAHKFKSRNQKKEAKQLVDDYKNKKANQSIYGARTLKAIDDILIEKEVDGSKGDNLIDSYVDLNIWLKDEYGEDTYYLSPAALLRLAALGTQILWDQNQLLLTADLDEVEESDINFMKKGFSKFTTSLAHVPSMIMTILCCIALIVCIIFTDIQYVMCIIEYTIVTGIGAFFIPFILFDGTKELPKKLVPVFMGFMMKMIVMDIIMFFIFNELIINTIQIITDDAGMNWVTWAQQIFFVFIAFILSANGPKIAQTIMTGQPQLSMGEFVQMAGAVAGTAMGVGRATSKAAKTTGHIAKEGTRKAAQTAVNAHGGISKMASAAKTASEGVKEMGGTKSEQRKAGAKGMFATLSGDIADKVRNKGNQFLHGGGKTGSSGGYGNTGAQAHQRSGQNTSNQIAEGESRTLSNTSNPKFQTATRFDERTQSLVNQKRSEFYDEKREQGKNIGAEIAKQYAERKESTQKKDDSLPDNLTGNERL